MSVGRPTGVMPPIAPEVMLTRRDAGQELGVAVCTAPQEHVETTIPVAVPQGRRITAKLRLAFAEAVAIVWFTSLLDNKRN